MFVAHLDSSDEIGFVINIKNIFFINYNNENLINFHKSHFYNILGKGPKKQSIVWKDRTRKTYFKKKYIKM